MTEGHPFFTAFAMFDIVRLEAGPGPRPALRDADVHRVWPGIATHLAEERFAVEWAGCTPAARDLLTSMMIDGRAPSVNERSRCTLAARLVGCTRYTSCCSPASFAARSDSGAWGPERIDGMGRNGTRNGPRSHLQQTQRMFWVATDVFMSARGRG